MADRYCTCAHCGAEFVTVYRRKIYCSRSCNHLAFVARRPEKIAEHRDKETAKRRAEIAAAPKFTKVYLNECATCGRLFYWRRKKARCSSECELRARQEYYKSRFVSAAVRAASVCSVCGVEFVTKTKSGSCCSDKCRRKKQNKGNKHSKRARLFGVEYKPVQPLKVFERDGWKCQICGKHTPQARRGSRYSNAPELDHRIPISKGGPHTYGNTQCACRACNGEKHNKSSVGQIPLFA